MNFLERGVKVDDEAGLFERNRGEEGEEEEEEEEEEAAAAVSMNQTQLLL